MCNTLAITKVSGDDYDANVGKMKDNALSQLVRTALIDNNDRKRACCIKNNEVIKALPYVDKTNNIKTGIIRVKVFDDSNDVNSNEKCKIDGGEYNSNDHRHEKDNYIYYDKEHACHVFYTKNFCPYAKANTDKDLQKYSDFTVNSDNAVLINNFRDCNCTNSFLNNGDSVLYKNDKGEVSNTDRTLLTYSLDKSCALEYTTNFKLIEKPTQNFCVNIANIAASDIENSDVKIDQLMDCTGHGGKEVDFKNPGGAFAPGGWFDLFFKNTFPSKYFEYRYYILVGICIIILIMIVSIGTSL